MRYPLICECRVENDLSTMNCDTKAIVDWLADGARSAADAKCMVAELCDRLVGCGIAVSRVGVFILTLHPQIMGRRFLWRPGAAVDVSDAPFEAFETEDFRRSPVRRVVDSGIAVRRRLAEENCPIDLTVVHELRAEGATDYLATPLVFTDGSVHGATWTTHLPGGFTDAQIAGLDAIMAPLARVIEILTLRQLANDFLDIYVGNQGGSRIFNGQIRRGHTETIDASIWLSDMRGFTSLSDRLAPQKLIDLINRFFDCQVPAILERGGEVLKFMGDGLLAIFPIIGDHAEACKVCDAALAAAIEARATVAARLGSPGDHDVEGVRFGLALHVGQVMYGNIGSGNRLDFTCIGPAVNLTARIEKLCSGLGRTILASDEFARHCPTKFVSVGDFALPGINVRQTVFGLEGEAVQQKP
jgi:adenylate cyclase